MITSNYQNKHPLDNWLRITVFFYAALFLSFSLNAQTVDQELLSIMQVQFIVHLLQVPTMLADTVTFILKVNWQQRELRQEVSFKHLDGQKIIRQLQTVGQFLEFT